MQSIEEKKDFYKFIRKTCFYADLAYFILHIFYFVIFLITKSYILFYLNIASLVIYFFAPIMLLKNKYFLFAMICGNEFLIFMSFGSAMLGFDTGFYLCIIGLCVVSFFTSYFAKSKYKSNSIIWCVLSLMLVLALYIASIYNEPYYIIPNWASTTLSIVHIVTIFGLIVAYLLSFITYAQKLETRIINESRIDNLTQIHNRYDFYNYIDSIEDKKDYVLSMFDIDDFKKINDIHGHIAGDYILKEIAKIATTKTEDSFVARYGGEEFIIITKMYGDYQRTFKMIDNVRKKIEEHDFLFNDIIIHITITIGVEKYDSDMRTEEWITKADEKLYEGKNCGKNITIG